MPTGSRKKLNLHCNHRSAPPLQEIISGLTYASGDYGKFGQLLLKGGELEGDVLE